MKFFIKENKIQTEKIEALLRDVPDQQLTEVEKETMLDSLRLHMRANPVQATPRVVKMRGWNIFSLHAGMSVAAVLLIVVLAGGTIVTAAQGTVPGDILYPVKINITEAAEQLLATDASVDAAVAAKHAVTRLTEVEKLAAQNKLDAKTKDSLAQAFQEYEVRFQKKVSALANEGNLANAVVLKSDFEGTLAAHGEILGSLATVRPDAEPELAAVTQVITNSLGGKFHTQASFKNDSHEVVMHQPSRQDIEVAQKSSLDKLAKAESKLNNKTEAGDVADADVFILKAKLDLAKQYQKDGETKLKDGDYQKALDSFAQANKGGQEIQTTYDVKREFKNDLRKTRNIPLNGAGVLPKASGKQ